jgi:hypothetical protein
MGLHPTSEAEQLDGYGAVTKAVRTSQNARPTRCAPRPDVPVGGGLGTASHRSSGKGGQPDARSEARQWQVPRTELRAGAPAKKGLWTNCELLTDRGAPVALLKFPKPALADASTMAELLGQVA